ncbi:MAG: CotH kinase family protein [Bacteroidota bacterium]
MARICYTFCLVFSVLSLAAQDLRINEVSAVNTLHLDEDGDSPDWLELRNFGSNSISLAGWQLTDDLDNEEHWTFPDITLAPDEHLLVWASAKDRNSLFVGRTFITQGDEFRYLIPFQAVANNWRTLDFDDNNWSTGNSGFGYNDGDDATEVPYGTRSVFVRKTFNITDVDQVGKLVLDMDHDDGFVAYINGVEIARNNLASTYPAFDAFAFANNEAQIYTNNLPPRYIIDNPEDFLQNGENVLSVQVHNATALSSDMSLIPFLSAMYKNPTTDGGPPAVLSPIPTGSLHTDFKISSAGETIYLLNADGDIADEIATTALPADVSIGIPYEGQDELTYFSSASPGTPNGGPTFSGLINDEVIFSHQGGMTNAFNLSLSGVSPPAVIRFTTDASVPTESSSVYTNPIPITENTVVRARIFRDGYLSSATNSRTYIIGSDHDLPIMSLVSEPDNLFDEEIGIYALGNDYDENFPYFGANFWEPWERPAHLSFYDEAGNLGIAFNGGMKIFGGWSRGQAQRSFALFARQQYGSSEISYPLFPNRPYESYQAFVLRNSGNDFKNTNLRDLTLTSLMEGAGLEFQAGRSVATYINGEYWGFYNMREKVNEHFLAAKFNLDPDEINILEKNSELVHGSNQSYLNLYDFISTNNMATAANYNQVAEQIDIENFIIYNVTQIYFNNTDWPGNNIKFWQPVDGKWRWILFDTDFAFGTWNEFDYFNNTIQFALEENGPGWPNPPWSTLVFRKLIDNLDFRNAFVNRFADEMNSRFLPEHVSAHIDAVATQLSSEINLHFDRWDGDLSNWMPRVNQMKNFGNLRQPQVKEHIKSAFNLPDYHPLNIMIADTDQGYVRVNDRLTIDENNWTGDYFEDVPFTVEAIAKPGYVFAYWEINAGNLVDPLLSLNITAPINLQPIFNIDPSAELPIVINEINYNSSTDFDTGDWVELYNPNAFAVDLSDWVFKDDDDEHSFVLPEGTIIEANSYWILTRDQDRFQEQYPDLERVIGDFDFGLSANGDAVRLYDDNQVLQDEVWYLPFTPWPVAASGQGPTLELIHPSLDNSLPENWANNDAYGSPGAENLLTATSAPNPLVQFRYFPNPFQDQVNLQFNLHEATHLTARLYDARGLLVQTLVDQHLNNGPHAFGVFLGDIPPGLYFLQVYADERRVFSERWLRVE